MTSTPAAPSAMDELESTVAMMAKIGACHSPSFSPDGARLAFISNLGGLPQVWTVSSEGGWPELVTTLEDPVAAAELRLLAENRGTGGITDVRHDSRRALLLRLVNRGDNDPAR